MLGCTAMEVWHKQLADLKEQGEESFLAGAQFRVLKALAQIGVDEELVRRILQPSFTAEMNFPVGF